MKIIYKIKNEVGWYCFKGTKKECEETFEEYSKENWFNPEKWEIVKEWTGYEIQEKQRKKVEDYKRKHWITKIKQTWQDIADKVLERLKYFNIKHKSWYRPIAISFIWPPSWVYGFYKVNLENWENIHIGWL